MKVVGNALQGPGFAEVRGFARVGEFRPAYSKLRETFPDLPDLGASPSKDQVVEALAAWESEPSHEPDLVEVTDDDANHMFGINGPNVLRECLRVVVVPAATNIAGQVGESGRGSALNELVGALMSEATTTAQAAWLSEHGPAMESLRQTVAASVERAVGVQQSRVNSNLAQYVPRASVTLTPTVPNWTPKPDASVATSVTIDGTTTDVSRQGHGVQRAVLMAMLQAFVPDADLMRSQHGPADSPDLLDDEAGADDELDPILADAIASLPSLVVCIEEPEVYQHPVRVRAFAKTLHALSTRPNVQVVVATHSPYFVRPEQFACLRRFSLASGASSVTRATAATIATQLDMDENAVLAAAERLFPTVFSEGYFADSVVLVEGGTDCVVLDALASLHGLDLDNLGIAVLEVGSKSALRLANALLAALGVPTFLIVDGDASGGQRKHPMDAAKAGEVDQTHRSEMEALVSWLPSGASPSVQGTYQFGDPTMVTSGFAIWQDDIEEELSSWPSLGAVAVARGLDITARKHKNRLAYKGAILGASASDTPQHLKQLLTAITGIAVGPTPGSGSAA